MYLCLYVQVRIYACVLWVSDRRGAREWQRMCERKSWCVSVGKKERALERVGEGARARERDTHTHQKERESHVEFCANWPQCCSDDVNCGEGGMGWWWVLFKHTIQAKKCTNVERALTRKRDTQKYAQSHTPFSFQVKLPCAAQEFNAGVSPKYDQKSVKCGSDWHDKIEKEQNTDKR